MIVALCGILLVVASLVLMKMSICTCSHSARLPGTAVFKSICTAPIRVVACDVFINDTINISNLVSAISVVCGADTTTADRYEARNDALRSIARRCDLSQNDVAMLMEYLRSTNDVMRAERVAALKNDVMNLLRIQSRPPEGFAETLVAMFALLGVLVLLGTKIFGPLK